MAENEFTRGEGTAPKAAEPIVPQKLEHTHVVYSMKQPRWKRYAKMVVYRLPPKEVERAGELHKRLSKMENLISDIMRSMEPFPEIKPEDYDKKKGLIDEVNAEAALRCCTAEELEYFLSLPKSQRAKKLRAWYDQMTEFYSSIGGRFLEHVRGMFMDPPGEERKLFHALRMMSYSQLEALAKDGVTLDEVYAAMEFKPDAGKESNHFALGTLYDAVIEKGERIELKLELSRVEKIKEGEFAVPFTLPQEGDAKPGKVSVTEGCSMTDAEFAAFREQVGQVQEEKKPKLLKR